MLACMKSPRRMHTASIVNLKGGVGKTTTCLGLADALARRFSDGEHGRVLMVDVDPQANLTQTLAPDLDDDELTINDVLRERRPGGARDAIRSTSWAGVDLIPSEISLAARDTFSGAAPQFVLRTTLQGIEDDPRGYKVILIDCNPSIGNLTVNAMVAADFIVMVTEASRLASSGVDETIANVEDAQQMREGLRVAGIICNKYDGRQVEEQYRLNELKERYGALVWEPIIPARAAAKSALGAGARISDNTDRQGRLLADIYNELATHIIEED